MAETQSPNPKPPRKRLRPMHSMDVVRPLRMHRPDTATSVPVASDPEPEATLPHHPAVEAELVAAAADTAPQSTLEAAAAATPAEPAPAGDTPMPGKKPKKSWSKRRKWLTIGGAAAAVIIAGGLAWAYTRPAHKTPAAAKITPKPATPTPTIVPDPLTGLMVAPSAASQPMVGVMIENLDPDARPQSGLGQAGTVYETLAEGGITRFLAIFQEPFPTVIGPVRSLRPYFLDWGLEHNIPVAHAGGSQPALAEIGPLGLKDINALLYDGSYFYRITARAAPHNLYTNATLLSELDAKLGFATAPTFTPLPYKADTPEATPTHPTINIDFSYADYNVQYQYNATTDSYARFMAGTAHIDANTNQQIMVKNIIVEFVPTTYGTQPDGDPMTIENLIGSGRALVFDDGGVTVGTWNKSSDNAQTKILDATGNPIAVNRGNTWYEVLPTINTVTY